MTGPHGLRHTVVVEQSARDIILAGCVAARTTSPAVDQIERTMAILVTGGAGFIGANFILDWLSVCDETVINLDKLSYAGNLENLRSVEGDPRHVFVRGDIADRELVASFLRRHRPRAILNFAAESHVDRSIGDPTPFITTNVAGTFQLLEAVRDYLKDQDDLDRASFRFIQVSTDEVFGSLGPTDAPFTESTAYRPNSPYSASKASADHLVRSYHHTFGLPTITTNCSNNFGPFQYPEKFIPVVINAALSEISIPVYGDGRNVRDWLYVSDHCDALRLILERGRVGATYNIGGDCELSNIELAKRICGLLDDLRPRENMEPHAHLIRWVADRPGHDFRYAVDSSKLKAELGWQRRDAFDSRLRKTVEWYAACHAGWSSSRSLSAS